MIKQPLTLALAVAGACALQLTAFADEAKPGGDAGKGPGGPGGPGGRKPPTAEERTNRLKTELGLSDDQAAKVLAIYQKAQETGKGIREDAAASPEDKRTKMGELMKSTAQEVGAVLTPEQKTKFEAEMAKRRAERGGPGGPGGGGGRREGGAKPEGAK